MKPKQKQPLVPCRNNQRLHNINTLLGNIASREANNRTFSIIAKYEWIELCLKLRRPQYLIVYPVFACSSRLLLQQTITTMADEIGTESRKRGASAIAEVRGVAKKSKDEKSKAANKTKAAAAASKWISEAALARGDPKWRSRVEEFYSWPVAKQEKSLPYCLSGIENKLSLSEFEKMIEYREKTGRSSQTGGCFKWEFKNGEAWIYELPHCCHERSAGTLGQLCNES